VCHLSSSSSPVISQLFFFLFLFLPLFAFVVLSPLSLQLNQRGRKSILWSLMSFQTVKSSILGTNAFSVLRLCFSPVYSASIPQEFTGSSTSPSCPVTKRSEMNCSVLFSFLEVRQCFQVVLLVLALVLCGFLLLLFSSSPSSSPFYPFQYSHYPSCPRLCPEVRSGDVFFSSQKHKGINLSPSVSQELCLGWRFKNGFLVFFSRQVDFKRTI
jgi:hypothetical protein